MIKCRLREENKNKLQTLEPQAPAERERRAAAGESANIAGHRPDIANTMKARRKGLPTFNLIMHLQSISKI